MCQVAAKRRVHTKRQVRTKHLYDQQHGAAVGLPHGADAAPEFARRLGRRLDVQHVARNLRRLLWA